ncbi:hypothetical protein OPQ81_000381 [Rhizoctonia solani]|nr:hypothetical protein OPQ81_000381 [Rhizoctonia solani]
MITNLTTLNYYVSCVGATGEGVRLSVIESHQPLKHYPEFFLDNTFVAIQMEGTLFNIHKYQLLRSGTFLDTVKVPKVSDGKQEERSSPEHPIETEGLKASEFEALLKMLYAR